VSNAEAVHIAVTRKIKAGMEEPFQDALRDFARESLGQAGTTGVDLIAPAPGGDSREFGILRSSESEAASSAFYQSELFASWQEQVAPMVEGECVQRRLHGLEAFFAPPQQNSWVNSGSGKAPSW
jgi:quinol monooxygenase YgiN